MIIRKLEYLNFSGDLTKVDLDIIDGKKIGIAYARDNGFVVYESFNDEWSNIFFIKTDSIPSDYIGDLTPNLQRNKEEFMGVINIISNDIYPDTVKEYEKKHSEFIFLKIMDMFNEGESEVIPVDSKYYRLIDNGYIKLNMDLLNNLL